MAFRTRTQLKYLINNCLFKQNNTPLENYVREFHRSLGLWGRIIPFNLSDIGEGITEVSVKEWFVKEGDKVSQFENICEVQSDKASVTITSRYDGIIKKIHYNVDQTAFVGKPLVDIEVEGKSEIPAQQERSENKLPSAEIKEKINQRETTSSYENDYSLCIPSVRRLAKQYKIDLRNVKGTGKNSRILKEDILRHLNEAQKKSEMLNHNTNATEEILKLKGFQKAMFQTMTESLDIPHFTYSEEIMLTKLSKLRDNMNAAPEIGLKLSFVPFFAKAISLALSEYPLLNSSLDIESESIIIKKRHNIGIAMNTKAGLAVPVICDVQNKRIFEIAQELQNFIKRGKDGNFSLEDLKDGTFTLSNIGVIGGVHVSPVILSPQVGIAAIGAIKTVPRFDENMKVYPEKILYITGAGDHRIIDGATMAQFINLVKKYIENPYLLLLKS